MAKTIGTIPSELSITNGDSVRVKADGSVWETFTPGAAAAGATTALDNLASVSINTDLIFQPDAVPTDRIIKVADQTEEDEKGNNLYLYGGKGNGTGIGGDGVIWGGNDGNITAEGGLIVATGGGYDGNGIGGMLIAIAGNGNKGGGPIEYTAGNANIDGNGGSIAFNVGTATNANSLATVTKNAGGTGYTAADVLTITGGNGDAQCTVDSVTGGVINSVTLTVPGTGYTNATAVAVTGGTGADATVDITVNVYTDGTINFNGNIGTTLEFAQDGQIYSGFSSNSHPDGYNLLFKAEDGVLTGRGGTSIFETGNSVNQSGAQFVVYGGEDNDDNNPGGIVFQSGQGLGNNQSGGNINFNPSRGNGSGNSGHIQFRDHSSALFAIFDTSLLTSTDKTFSFPDATGVLGVVVTKTDTGDPDGAEGVFEINTFDNVFKVYADGGWRQLATW